MHDKKKQRYSKFQLRSDPVWPRGCATAHRARARRATAACAIAVAAVYMPRMRAHMLACSAGLDRLRCINGRRSLCVPLRSLRARSCALQAARQAQAASHWLPSSVAACATVDCRSITTPTEASDRSMAAAPQPAAVTRTVHCTCARSLNDCERHSVWRERARRRGGYRTLLSPEHTTRIKSAMER